jgi:hypothetical protein
MLRKAVQRLCSLGLMQGGCAVAAQQGHVSEEKDVAVRGADRGCVRVSHT